eukprot:scaffold8087_cov90-Skeletonema_dohrnii-CCMP3373.AAC.1
MAFIEGKFIIKLRLGVWNSSTPLLRCARGPITAITSLKVVETVVMQSSELREVVASKRRSSAPLLSLCQAWREIVSIYPLKEKNFEGAQRENST